MKDWKTLSKELVHPGNKFLKVENHKVIAPNGQVIEDWQTIIAPDFVSITAVTDEDKFIILRVNKYAVQHSSIATVGGYIEPGEKPLDAAKRELLEETGYESPDWVPMGNYIIDSNRGCGNVYFFLAKNAKKIGEPTEIDIENPEVILMSKNEIEHAINNNEFKVLPWATNILLALKYL